MPGSMARAANWVPEFLGMAAGQRDGAGAPYAAVVAAVLGSIRRKSPDVRETNPGHDGSAGL
jgi:hypothetical protein